MQEEKPWMSSQENKEKNSSSVFQLSCLVSVFHFLNNKTILNMFLSFSIQYLGDEDSGGCWGLKKNWGRHWRPGGWKTGEDTGDLSP